MTLRRLPFLTCRILAALLLALGMLSAPAGPSASHDPVALATAEAERHAEMQAGVADHGHVHDDGDDSERSPGHAHGHDPADHSHDKAGAPPVYGPGEPTLRSARHVTFQSAGQASLSATLRRPPRPSFAA